VYSGIHGNILITLGIVYLKEKDMQSAMTGKAACFYSLQLTAVGWTSESGWKTIVLQRVSGDYRLADSLWAILVVPAMIDKYDPGTLNMPLAGGQGTRIGYARVSAQD